MNEKNIEIFNKGDFDEDEEVFTCVICGQKTCYGDSYSRRGANLTCRACAEKKTKELGFDFTSEYVSKYIHRDS